MLRTVVDVFLHLDKHLGLLVSMYGPWVYAMVFAVVFLETGLVVTPILPGDSLLFACGTIAATGALDPWLLFVLLAAAAILGDTVNYSIGKAIGPIAYSRPSRLFKREHLLRTHAFFERHGGKTIVIARFVPIVRTFAPFVAGIGTMSYPRFLAYNVVGGTGWVAVGLGAGYAFGNIPVVKENFSIAIIAVVILSLVPILVEYLRHRRASA